MSFVFNPSYLYTVTGLLLVIVLNTLWAVGHALATGTFDSTRLPDFLIDDVFKLVMLSFVGLAAMVTVADGSPIVVTIFEGFKFIFGGFTVLFGGSLLADLKAKFEGKFGPVEPTV